MMNIKRILKGEFNRIGSDVKIKKPTNIAASTIKGNINIGANCLINKTTIKGTINIGKNCRIVGADIIGSNIEIGNYTSIWGPSIFINQKINSVKIGNYCSIARGFNIQEFNHNHKKITTYYIGQNFFKESWENENVSNGAIEIGNDVWIGADVLVLSGVKIGNGCVVAGNATVTKSFPDYAIIGGTPAKILGYRFDEEKIKYLQDLKWWDWSEEKMLSNKKLFEAEFTV